MSFAAWDQNLAFGRLGFVSSRYRPYYEDGSGIPLAFQKTPGLEELAPGAGLGEKNLLVTRFLAIPAFRDLYDRAYREQFTRLFASGQADKMLDRLGAVIRSANASRNLVDPARFESDLKRDHNFITDRMAYLRTVAPVAPTPSP
jgi:spore coat protein CotH